MNRIAIWLSTVRNLIAAVGFDRAWRTILEYGLALPFPERRRALHDSIGVTILVDQHLQQQMKRASMVENLKEPKEKSDGAPAVAVKITGGLGDFLIIARFLRDFSKYVEPVHFDIYSGNVSSTRWAFESVPGFRKAYQIEAFEKLLPLYDAAFYISQFVIFYPERADWEILRKFPKLAKQCAAIMKRRSDIELFVNHHPHADGYLGNYAVYSNCNRNNFLHNLAGIPYGGDSFDLFADHSVSVAGRLGETYITVHNGFDTEFPVAGRTATKCYPHFDQVVNSLKATFPDIKFVQIGSATSTPIPGVDLDLISKTTLEQAAGIISKAALHIDNEGGLVHLAACLGTKSCVVFGPTDVRYFAYDSNLNIEPTFCGGCWWVTKTWMETCPRKFPVPRCMHEQDPLGVAQAIAQFMSARAPEAA